MLLQKYLTVSEVRTGLWYLDIGEEMLKQSFVFQACLNAPAILQMPWIGKEVLTALQVARPCKGQHTRENMKYLSHNKQK